MINSGGKNWIKNALSSLSQTSPDNAPRTNRTPLSLDELEARVVPTLLGQQLFPTDYPTNVSIANAPVSANSANWISQMAASRSKVHVDWGAYTSGSGGDLYSMAYNVVHSKDTTNYANVKVYINNYPNESEISGKDAGNGNRPYMLIPLPKANPQGVFIEGDGQNGADPSRIGDDSHMLVWDADTNTSYEFWQATRPSESTAANNADIYLNAPIANQWNAANGAVWDMSKNSFRTLGYTSGDAAGLPMLANIARPDEALPASRGGQSATPVIDHAIRFTLPSSLIDNQFTYPAVHTTSSSGTIPYGTRFRLQNNTTVNNLIATMGPQAQVVAKAMQTYGLILADIGTAMYIQGSATAVDTNNNPIVDPTTGKAITWDMNDILGGLQSILTTYFEAVDLTPKVTSLSSSSGSAGNTITITGSNFKGSAGHLSVLFVPPGNTPPYTTDGQTTNLKAGVVAVNTVTIVDDQHIQVVVPAGTGTVDIQVLSGQLLNDTYNGDAENATAPIFGYGLSTAVGADKFTYSSAPAAPAITTQPTDQTVNAGQTATFTATASGSPTPTVQWQVSTDGGTNWNDVAGATSTTYAFTTAIGQNGNRYRAVFTNATGTATTNAAGLTVNPAPVAPTITTQPTDQNVASGQMATFTAGATGTPTPTVQWQRSTNGGSTWNNIAGATSTTYSFTTAIGQNGNKYRAVFTNTAGNATTNAATLTVSAAPVAPSITTQPTNQAVTAGQMATFTAGASGSPTPTVQWQVSTNGGTTWNDIAGATTTTYSFTTSAGQNGTRYRAVFTNASGSATTNGAILTVNVAPAITAQPTDQGVTAGQMATFTAGASGTPTPTVQWQISTNGGGTWNNIAGATNTTYSFTAAIGQNGARYRAVFTNTAGNATTNAATLTVSAAPVAPAITTQPTNQSATAGQTATFTAGASGVPTPTVQWQTSTNGGGTWSDILGATSATLSFTTALAQTGSQYRAVFTNASGSATTNPATLTVNPAPIAPAITTQPTDQSVTVGQSASFTAAASGTPTPTVQWQVSTNGGSTWSDIAGATNTTYSFTTTIGQTGSQYRAVFTNSAGSATTNAATLTVSATPVAPAITTQPTDQMVFAGQQASFMAGASGVPTPTVQWQVSTNGGSTWSDIPGATSATYSFTTALAQSGSQYRAVFTNNLGSATTNAATLTVNPTVAPVITTQPTDLMVMVGQTATFTAGASGAPVPTVQWQVSTNGGSTWTNITGATSTTYSFTATGAQSGSQYRAVFTNLAGSATTNAATLTITATAPVITTQPTDQNVTPGQTATFTAGASGFPAPTVQWQVSTNGGSTWNDIPGATSTTLSFAADLSQSGSQYRAVFTNSVGSATTNAATLTVNAATIAPTITTQPTNQTAMVGQTVSFTAGADGTPTPTVQWQTSTDGGTTWNDVPGATSTTLSFAAVAGQSGAQYRAVFTNSAGSATTNAVTLTVNQSYLAVGGADGTMRLYGADGSALATVNPIAGYTGLLSVALGDFNGDAIPELLVAAATPAGVSGLTTSSAGKVFVYDGAAAAKGNLSLIHTFTPFATTAGPAGTTGAYTNGLNIAVGDVNGDGKLDLIAGTRSVVGGVGGTQFGKAEFGRLAVVNAGAAANGSDDTLIGSILTPFGTGYQKGVVVAAGSLDGGAQDEIAVTRGGPVNNPSAAVQSIKLKVFRFASNSLQELDLTGGGKNADGSSKQPLAPFALVPGTIKRDARLAFTDANGDGKDELVFSAIDPVTTPGSNTVRVVAYNVDTGTGKATVASTGAGPNSSYTVGSGVSVSFDTAAATANGTAFNLAIALTPDGSTAGTIQYIDPLSGSSLAGQFALSVVTGGVSLGGRFGTA